MAAKKAPLEVTPRGVAGYAKYLYEKDTKFQKDIDKAKYSISVLIPKADLANLKARIDNGETEITGEEWVARLNKMHEDAGGGKKTAPVKDGDKVTNKDGEKYENMVGHWVVQMKSGFQPKLIDTKRNPLPDDVRIFGGDIVKVAYRPSTYDGFGGGVTLYLQQVMLIDKRNTSSAEDAFGDEAGFVVYKSDNDVFGEASEDDNSGDY